MTTATGWDRYRETLHTYALHLTRNPADAQDLVQDTLLRAYLRRQQLRREDAILGWLRSILYHIFCSRRVRARRRGEDQSISLSLLTEQGEGSLPPCPRSDPESQSLLRADLDAVTTAIRQLPGDYRHCLLLSDVDNLRYQEIADRLGVPLSTVKTRLFRARQRVQKSLRSQGFDCYSRT